MVEGFLENSKEIISHSLGIEAYQRSTEITLPFREITIPRRLAKVGGLIYECTSPALSRTLLDRNIDAKTWILGYWVDFCGIGWAIDVVPKLLNTDDTLTNVAAAILTKVAYNLAVNLSINLTPGGD